MLIELFLTTLLLSPAGSIEAAEPPVADDGWVATLRRYSLRSSASWTLRLWSGPDGKVTARAWWIVGPPPDRGVPERLAEARTADLNADDCDPLDRVVRALEQLTVPAPALPREPQQAEVFVLETPDHAAIDLLRLDPEHPLLMWADGAWDQLSECRR